MNEAVAGLLDLLVSEILWPLVEQRVKKHGPALVQATTEQLRIFAEKALSMLTKDGRLNTRRLITDFQSQFGLQLTGEQRGRFLEFIEKMEALYQGNLGSLLGKKAMADEVPPKLASAEPDPTPAPPPVQIHDSTPVSSFSEKNETLKDPLAWTSQAFSRPADPFCPKCGAVILEDESKCRQCGTARATRPASAAFPDPKSFFQRTATTSTRKSLEESLAVKPKETAWSRFFAPTEDEIQAVYVQIARSPCVEQNPDYRNRAARAVFRYLPHRADINAYAQKKTNGTFEVVFYGGLIVAQRVVAAAVAAGDSQAGGKGELKQPIQQALGIILRAIKKHNQAFHSRNGHNLYRHFLSESAMANPHLGCSQAIAQAMHGHVIAHEFGHHFFGHTSDESAGDSDSSRMQERQVDAFALQLLDSLAHRDFSHLGAILSILTLAIMHQDPSEEGSSHPAPLERLELVFKNREASEMCEARFGITADLCNRIVLELQESREEDDLEIPDILELE
jgi:DNA-directed RNA polymerase subunit M/transcription elongation factor TFIIS